ncbi:MAG: sle [Paenibacillus sp.]|jgi:hypothetical protein|nr:sle [Paenibacillus sp.]
MIRQRAVKILFLPVLTIVSVIVVTLPLKEVNAHHGWIYFDTNRPYYLEGTVEDVDWRNPHPEIVLKVTQEVTIPRDVEQLPLPQELIDLNIRHTLDNLSVPENAVKNWNIILAPVNRLENWGMPEPVHPGNHIRAIGYISCDDPDEFRPELLILSDDKTVRQRSVPLPESSCKDLDMNPGTADIAQDEDAGTVPASIPPRIGNHYLLMAAAGIVLIAGTGFGYLWMRKQKKATDRRL